MRRKVLSVMLLLAVVVLLSNLANAQHHGGDPYDPFNDCAVCHGEDLAGAMFGADWAPSCFDCHCQFLSAGNQPPVADPNGPYTGTVGQPVQFDGSGSTDP